MDSERSFVLEGTARRHHWRGAGGFSIKSFQGGAAYYRIGAAARRVDPESLFLVNQDVEYEIEIESPQPVNAFCLFFRSDLLPAALAARTRSAEWHLEHPETELRGSLPLVQQLHDRRIPLGRAVDRMRNQWRMGTLTAAALEEGLLDLADGVVSLALELEMRCQGLAATKSSTKRELYRRASLARDYIHSHWEEPITLAQIGRAASLSTSHLLRVFRMVFGVSPGRYLQEKRLREAANRLEKSSQPVSGVGWECGFESVPSFSRLFRQRFGLSPVRYRKMIRSDKSSCLGPANIVF